MLYIKTLQDTAKVSDKKRNGNLGRVAETRHKAQVKINHVFIVIYILYWLVTMTISVADVLRARECIDTAEDHAKGPKRGKLPVICVDFSLLFPALTQSSGCRPTIRNRGLGNISLLFSIINCTSSDFLTSNT